MWNGDSQTETSATEDVQGEGEAEGEEEEEDNIFHWQDTLMREVSDEHY